MEDSAKKSLSNRKVYYDFIRLAAIFLVIFNHTPAFDFPFRSNIDSMGDWFILLIAVSDKVAVPLFFMMSGALLLPKQEPLNVLLKKRVFRYALVILIFCMMQTAYCAAVEGCHILGVRNFITLCYKGDGCIYYETSCWVIWFLYAYLGFLLMLPFLRAMVTVASNALFIYLFVIQIVCCVILPSLYVILTGSSPQGGQLLQYLPLCGNAFVCVLAGYYVENRVDISKLNAKHLALMLVASMLFVGMATVLPELARIRMHASQINMRIPELSAFMLLPCMTIVLIIKKLCSMVSFSPRLVSWLNAYREYLLSESWFKVLNKKSPVSRVVGNGGF